MFSFLILLVAAISLGTWALRPFALAWDVVGGALRVLAGLTCCSVIAIAVGSVSVSTAWGVLVAIALAGLVYDVFLAKLATSGTSLSTDDQAPLCWTRRISTAVVMTALIGALLSASAPATTWDATAAHLALPRDYVRDGFIHGMEGNSYSAYPHLPHALMAVAFYGGGELAAQWICWGFAAICCAIVYGIGVNIATPTAGAIAAAMMATAPIFVDQAGTASIDYAFTAFVLAALYGTLQACATQRIAWLVLAGCFVGSAIGVRHTALLIAPLLFVGVANGFKSGRARGLIAFVGAGVLAAIPWLLRAYLVSGNPIYPFFNAQFGVHGIPDFDITGIATHESTRSIGALAFLRFPWDIIMKPAQFDGWMSSPGPWVLFLGIPGILVGDKRTRALAVFAITGACALYFFRQYARYFLPFFAPMYVVAAVAVVRLPSLALITRAMLALSFALGIALHGANLAIKAPVLVGRETRDEYLTRRVERYPAFAWINETIKTDSVILTQENRTYYIEAPTYQNYLALTILKRKTDLEQLRWLRARGVKYWLYVDAYVNETPAFRNLGLVEMFGVWRRDSRHFALIKRFELPRVDGEGTEIVELYELRYDAPNRAGEFAQSRLGS